MSLIIHLLSAYTTIRNSIYIKQIKVSLFLNFSLQCPNSLNIPSYPHFLLFNLGKAIKRVVFFFPLQLIIMRLQESVYCLQRDDLSGMQLSGNKVRKLEFLMADAVKQGADCIVTIGGIQSNHCRATAVAAKYLNLDCYLILRTSKVL